MVISKCSITSCDEMTKSRLILRIQNRSFPLPVRMEEHFGLGLHTALHSLHVFISHFTSESPFLRVFVFPAVRLVLDMYTETGMDIHRYPDGNLRPR